MTHAREQLTYLRMIPGLKGPFFQSLLSLYKKKKSIIGLNPIIISPTFRWICPYYLGRNMILNI